MSGRVGSAISKSDMVENVGVAVEIASPSVCVKKVFLLPVSTSGFVADIRVFGVGRCRAVLTVDGVISKSGMVENVGLAVEIASPSVSVQKLLPLPVSTSGFEADI